MFDFDLNKVPEEMREASRRLHEAIRRERHAKKQYDLWRTEFESAGAILKAEEKSYGEVSLRWDPDTQTMQPSREDAPIKKN